MNCKRCSEVFTPKTYNQIFCSNECKVRYHCENAPSRKQYFAPTTCLWCKKEFTPTRHKAKYCSSKCCDNYRNHHKPRKTNKSYSTANALKEQPLSENEKQVVLGTLLGDGSLIKTPSGVRLSLCQSENQLPYLLWKKEMLPHLIITDKPSKYEHKYKDCPTIQYHLHSIHHPALEGVYLALYKDGIKTVTNELLNKLNPLAIATWYMDDGSFNRNPKSKQIFWATDSFSENEHQLIINWLHDKYSVEAKLQFNKNRGSYGNRATYRIRINRTQTGKFFDMVRPYIHPSMLYKIE